MNARQAKHLACAVAARELQAVLENPEYLDDLLPRLSAPERRAVTQALDALRVEMKHRGFGTPRPVGGGCG